MSFQSCNFVGRLGRDAEQKFLASGTAVLTFSIPVDSGYGDKKKTFWLRATVFGKQAEGKLVDYLKKGQEVAISGELSLNEYEKDGQTKTSVELRVNQIQLVGGKTESAPQQQDRKPQAQKPRQEDQFEDDIPF